MKKFLLAAVSAAVVTMSAAPATAATVVVSLTVNLNTINLATGSVVMMPVPAVRPTLAQGDVLDLRLDFTGDQALTFDVGPASFSRIWLFGDADNRGTFFTSTASLTFADATGVIRSTPILDTETSGMVHYGNEFSASQFATGSGRGGFSGLRLLATVTDYVDDNTHTYTGTYLNFGGSNFSIGTVAAVPETATWGMMIAGFGMIGGALRARRRSTSVSFA